MNILAHLYLSGHPSPEMVGNFIGDFIKGKKLSSFSEPVRKGILIHREIDTYTDQHPVVSVSKDRLRAKHRHYSGVIVDIFYDHFLAARWNQFSSTDLNEYLAEVFTYLEKNQTILPDRATDFLLAAKKGKWVQNYASISGIQRVLKGMDNRTKFNSNMEYACEQLNNHYLEFEREFFEFFPQLEKHIELFSLEMAKKRGNT